MFFLELFCFFDDPTDVGNLISGSSAFSKTSLNIWKFTNHVLLKPGLENFEHYFTSMWDEYNCAVVWAFFGIAFLWDCSENWPFPVLWATANFSKFAGILSAARSQHHLSEFEIAQLEFHLRSPREICFFLLNSNLPTCILPWKHTLSLYRRSGLHEWVQIWLKGGGEFRFP